jgi:hypothetical protein
MAMSFLNVRILEYTTLHDRVSIHSSNVRSKETKKGQDNHRETDNDTFDRECNKRQHKQS